MTTTIDRDLDRDLALLADVPPPRRTEAAFARAVVDDVKHQRSRHTLFVLPALAAATAAAALVLVVQPHDVRVAPVHAADAGTSKVAVVAPVHVDVAAADLDDDDEDLFALPELEGSSDEELARLDKALDAALTKH